MLELAAGQGRAKRGGGTVESGRSCPPQIEVPKRRTEQEEGVVALCDEGSAGTGRAHGALEMRMTHVPAEMGAVRRGKRASGRWRLDGARGAHMEVGPVARESGRGRCNCHTWNTFGRGVPLPRRRVFHAR